MPRRIKHPVLKVGSIFFRTFKEKKYSLKVIKGKDGIEYLLSNKKYASLSGAAKSITKNETNGWRFWGLVKYDNLSVFNPKQFS